MTQRETSDFTGRPMTEEVQAIFGGLGVVRGLIVKSATQIEVQYEEGHVATFAAIKVEEAKRDG